MDIVSIRKLGNLYASHTRHAVAHLEGEGFIELLPREKRGAPRSFKIAKPLPTPADVAAALYKKFTCSLDDLIVGATSDLEELRDELQDWHGNLPDAFQEGDKGQQLQEAIDGIENVIGESFDLPQADLPNLPTAVHFPGETKSRADRACDAADRLESAAGAITNWIDEMEPVKEGEEDDKVDRDEWTALADSLSSAADDIRGVDFPGMY